MKIQPAGEHLAVKPIKIENKTESGILTDANEEESVVPDMGIVLAVGDHVQLGNGELATMNLEEGDKVLFEEFAKKEYEFDGEVIWMLRYKDLLGKVIEE